MVKWRTFTNMAIMGDVKEKSIKRRKHEKISLTFSFSHSFIIKG